MILTIAIALGFWYSGKRGLMGSDYPEEILPGTEKPVASGAPGLSMDE